MVDIKLKTYKDRRREIGRSWELSIQSFINDRRINNCSDRTVQWHTEILGYFKQFIDQAQIESPEDFYEEDLHEYIIYLRDVRKNQPGSINVKLKALRTFFYYLADKEYISHKFKIKLLKENKKILPTFSEEDIKKLIAQPDKNKVTFAEYRDWAIICFLLGTGVRMNTMLNVKIEDIDFIAKEIQLLVTKTRTEQIIPLSPSLETVLNGYLDIRGGEPSHYLFSNSYGDQLKSRTLQDRILLFCNKRGVDTKMVRCSPHTFRHTFAKQAVLNGMDLFTLQKILGHSTLEMVRRYVNLLTDDVRRRFISPLDTLSKFARHKGRKTISIKRAKQ